MNSVSAQLSNSETIGQDIVRPAAPKATGLEDRIILVGGMEILGRAT